MRVSSKGRPSREIFPTASSTKDFFVEVSLDGVTQDIIVPSTRYILTPRARFTAKSYYKEDPGLQYISSYAEHDKMTSSVFHFSPAFFSHLVLFVRVGNVTPTVHKH